MLQAIVQQKARSFLLRGGVHVPREDVMTSGVFGCLQYFSTEDASLVLSWLLPMLAPSAAFESIEFWPRPERNGCEPDAIIRWRSSAGAPSAFLLEAKYGRNSLGYAQIKRQWNEFGERIQHDEKRSVTHLLVVQHAQAIELAAVDDPRTRVVTWRDLRDNLFHRTAGPPHMVKLAADVVSFIERGGGRPFAGWSPVPLVAEFSLPIFYK